MRPVCWSLAALLVASPALAKPKLAVMEIQDAQNLGASLVESLTDSLRSLLARSGQFIVIDKSRQAAALRKLITAQKRESYKACYDNRCQIPLGQALAADSILRTKLTRVGSQYLLIAELVDLEKEAVTSAAQAQVAVQPTSGRDDRLLQGVLSIARQLSGGPVRGQPLSSFVQSSVVGSHAVDRQNANASRGATASSAVVARNAVASTLARRLPR